MKAPDCVTGDSEALQRFYERQYESYRHGLWRRQPMLIGPALMNRAVRRRDPGAGEGPLARRYREKRHRVMEAVALRTPDRIPIVSSGLNFYPAYYAGTSFADYCGNRKACRAAFMKFVEDHDEFDAVFPSHICCWGSLFTATGLDVIQLPGVQLPDNVSYQFVEKERLAPDEYPLLLEGGYDFFRSTVLPRMTPRYHSGSGWEKKAMARAAAAALAYGLFYVTTIEAVERRTGMPVSPGSFTFAPFDLISFLFRDLPGVSTDLFRQPEMVERTADLMVGVCLPMAESAATASGTRETVILCERAFSLSPRQFERFYFPSLKRLVTGLIERGIAPLVALEGDCTHLLDYVVELPNGKCIMALDTTDISEANRVLKGRICFTGNVPMNLMVLGTPEEVRDYCARLIDECAPGGGFIMAGALGIPDNARPENVRAMLDYTLEHGSY
ncbi:MAG: hypothetical protein KKF41_12445 [Actinobacteria bacterium]|nr:hypothetical protein [Actinomycetota bacterium]MBU1944223.1 hypothetical protein [Actinomycetota bacterium]MBU2688384.1 hypothetical protein [Actinomycetota bacterium]